MKNLILSHARIVRICGSALLLSLAAPLAAHPSGDFFPDAPGPVTILTPDQVENAPFLPDAKNNPIFLAYEELASKLEAKHVNVKVHSLAVFNDGFLLNSSASPATVRYILKYKLLGDGIAWTESGDADNPSFNLTVPDNGSFRITFPAKDWLLFAANRPPEPAEDPSEAKKPDGKKTGPAAASAG